MAKFVIRDCVITVGGVDLSNYFSDVTVDTDTEEVDVTGMSTAAYRETQDGFHDATIEGSVFQDFAAGKVDATLWALGPGNTAGTTFAVTVKATSASTSATNPIYTMATAKLFKYTPLAGGVGDAASTPVTFKNAGTAGLTRGTS